MNWPASEFWTFSLGVYARPEVARSCLKLQDEAGADVNILLFSLWLASLGRAPLTADKLDRIDRHLAPWRKQVIHPLRQARRALAQFTDIAQAAALKTAAQQLELDSEHQAQLMLEAIAGDVMPQETTEASMAETAAISIGIYLKMIAPEREEVSETAARLLAQDAFKTML